MKYLLLLVLISPFELWAQSDTLKPVRTETLKLIESEITPGYGRYRNQVHIQYIYDGLDVRHAKDLGQYIMASGDPDAIREFNAYKSSRHAGGWLIAGGIASVITGFAIMMSNGPGADGKFTTTQQLPMQPGIYYTGGNTITVPDVQRQNTYSKGGVILLGGALLGGIGWGLCLPGKHLRRSVQYYNKALKQQGISWQVKPYSSYTNAGLGLVGWF
jgi:hypothetical protein